MILKTSDKTIDFKTLGYQLKTKSYDQSPSKNYTKETVIGGIKEFVFENGLKNKKINVVLQCLDSISLATRRINARDITPSLLNGGELTLDYEPDIYWNVKVLNNTSIDFGVAYDTLSIEFDAEPMAYKRYTATEIAIDGTDINITNSGNCPSYPLIEINGTGNITLTHSDGNAFTITGLTGTIFIDTENMIVYDDLKASQLSKFTGDFLNLDVGSNIISTSGTGTIKIHKKDRVI